MKKFKLTRRNFLKNSSIGLLGTGLLFSRSRINYSPRGKKFPPQINEYRRLGRTELMVSDIGSGVPYSESVLKAVLSAGVNFIETAESYSNGRNEILIGNAIKNVEREKLVIATKAYPAFELFKSADDIVRRAEDSLKRLQTHYIDVYMVHQAQNIVAVKNDYFHKACDRLKKEGKIRFTGLSCHGVPWWEDTKESLEDILMTAIEDGRFDVIFCPYNFLAPDMGERILKACNENDIGTMIMKANPVDVYDNYDKILKRNGTLEKEERKDYDELKVQMENAGWFFEKYNMTDIESMKDGAIQFILTNKNVHTICCRFRNYSDIEKYVSLSGTTLNDRMASLLNDFKKSIGFLNCRIGCNICEQACPNKIPVNTILRYNYYFTKLKHEKEAIKQYLELPGAKADVCSDCEGYCEKACPYNVSTRTLLTLAHQNLNFDGHFA